MADVRILVGAKASRVKRVLWVRDSYDDWLVRDRGSELEINMRHPHGLILAQCTMPQRAIIEGLLAAVSDIERGYKPDTTTDEFEPF